MTTREIQVAQVLIGYIIVFLITIKIQLLWKPWAYSKWKASKGDSKVAYNRYTDVNMLPVDRAIGNFIEWELPFVALFLLDAYFVKYEHPLIQAGWVYVFCRLLYPFAAILGGK